MNAPAALLVRSLEIFFAELYELGLDGQLLDDELSISNMDGQAATDAPPVLEDHRQGQVVGFRRE